MATKTQAVITQEGLIRDKVTTGTVKFDENDEFATLPISNLYVRKSAFRDFFQATGAWPEEIEVDIRIIR